MRNQHKPFGPAPYPGTPEPNSRPGTGPNIPDSGSRPRPERESSPHPDIERGSDLRPREFGSPSRMRAASGPVRSLLECSDRYFSMR